jgi:hypothetical protein
MTGRGPGWLSERGNRVALLLARDNFPTGPHLAVERDTRPEKRAVVVGVPAVDTAAWARAAAVQAAAVAPAASTS